MSEDFRARARLVPKGNRYEDFEPGRVFKHHWGRTINESESTLFSTLTLHFNPHYFNADYAQAHGHPGIVVNPLLVFNTVFGLSVEDLSEGGGPFLGVDELTYHQPVYPGDTLRARIDGARPPSLELATRASASSPGTRKGFNQRGELVIDFKRTNLVRTGSRSNELHDRRAPHDPGAGARVHDEGSAAGRQQARPREGRHPDGPARQDGRARLLRHPDPRGVRRPGPRLLRVLPGRRGAGARLDERRLASSPAATC